MSSHGALQQSVMAQRIESLVLPVALPGGEDQREAAWSPSSRNRFSSATNSASGVPIPTKPDVQIVSAFWISAAASVAVVILLRIGFRSIVRSSRHPLPELGRAPERQHPNKEKPSTLPFAPASRTHVTPAFLREDLPLLSPQDAFPYRSVIDLLLHERGQNPAGTHGIAGYGSRSSFECNHLGKTNHAVLCCKYADLCGLHQTVSAGYVDNTRPAPLKHLGKRSTD